MAEDPDDDLKIILAMICTFLLAIALGVLPFAFCFCCSLIKIQRAKNDLIKEMAAYDEMGPPPVGTVVAPPPPTMNRAMYPGIPPPYARFGPGQAPLLPGPGSGSIAQPYPAAAYEQQEPKSSEKL